MTENLLTVGDVQKAVLQLGYTRSWGREGRAKWEAKKSEKELAELTGVKTALKSALAEGWRVEESLKVVLELKKTRQEVKPRLSNLQLCSS